MKRKFIYLLLLALPLTMLNTSCRKWLFPEGPTVSQNRDVAYYSALNVEGSFNIILTDDSSQTLTIKAGSHVMRYIVTSVEGNVLHIKVRKHIFRRVKEATVIVPALMLNDVELNGSGDISGATLNDDHLSVKLNGSGDINLGASCNRADVSLGGSGNITLSGTSVVNNLHLDGSGDIQATNLFSDSTYAYLNGSGNIKCWADSYLYAKIDGSGDIIYKGDPVIDRDINGSGSVHH